MGCTRKTCGHDFDCYKLAESIPVDTVTDGTVLSIGPDAELVIDPALPIAGVVYAPNTNIEGCVRYFAAGDQVDVQETGKALVIAGAAIAAGDVLDYDAAGKAIVSATGRLGVAVCDAVADGVVEVKLRVGGQV